LIEDDLNYDPTDPLALLLSLAFISSACAGSNRQRPDDHANKTNVATPPLPGCAAQQCDGEGDCDAVFGHGEWIWTGEQCKPFYASGCNTVGADCASTYHSRDDCEKARAACTRARS